MKTTYMLRPAVLVAVFMTITSVTPAFGQMLSWRVKYDDLGRIVRSVDPAGQITKYGYTPVSDGPTRIITVTPPAGAPVTWQFDTDGQLAAMKDGEGAVIYSYDSRGRLGAIARKGAPVIRYNYDATGRLSELLVGDVYRIIWTYDFLGRIAAIETPAGQIRYEYWTGQGTVVRSLPNGVKTFWKRQVNGELEEITHGYFKRPDDTSYSVLAQYTYAHGPEGRIADIRELSGRGKFIHRYTYDTIGRLTHATEPGEKYGYEYDLVGNRIRATAEGRSDQLCAFDWAGRLTAVNGKSSQYDASGNLARVIINGVTRQYRYHPDGRLAESQKDGEIVQYRYDGFGRLVSRKTAGDETRFIPDPLSPYWQPLVIDESNGMQTLVIWDGPIPLALVSNGKVEWLLHDHLGSVRLVTDVKGDVSRTCEYDPFGVPLDIQHPITPAPGFAGLFWDDWAGAYLTLARTFMPELGSFLQPDPQKRVPQRSPQSLSMWSYCGASPVEYIDRDGREQKPHETVTFDANTRWWDSYLRASDYHTFGWVRSLLGHSDAPLVVNTNPDVRMSVVIRLYSYASSLAKGDPNKTRKLLRNWRFKLEPRPVEHGYDGAWITEAEWQSAADLAIAEQYVETGKAGLLPTKTPGKAAARFMKYIYAPLWSASHYTGETFGIPPSSFLSVAALKPKKFPPGIPDTWRPWTSDTEKAYQQGIQIGLDRANRGANIRPEQVIELPSAKTTQPGIDPNRLKKARELADIIMKQIDAAKGVIKKHNISGGDWRVAGPGGMASPDAYAASREFQGISQKLPSPVGGVYLGGGGGAIDGFGTLKGVKLDANSNLILIGEDDKNIKLPPLRIDDVVTIFRSVYLHGEGPTVTIDPNPQDPEGSAMIIRHGKATENTYVGWILYQADRLMKVYGQGVDNITQKDIVSAVPGYAEILDTIYFGADDPRKKQKKGIWERFWIVPAEVRRFEGSRRELTTFDVPLKVKTQKMKWEKDKLVDDLKGKSSPGALAFKSWFTTNYDGIATEQYLTPPPESGITTVVPVFAELQRIALMTAVAEKLRDDGVPMPFWMYDHEVRKVPFEQYTPGMEVTWRRKKGNTTQTAKIFGGVKLSADRKTVKTYATDEDKANAPIAIRAEVDRGIKLANKLERTVTTALSPVTSASLEVHRITDDKRDYQVISIPGAQTLALGPCRLDEVDIFVPITGGTGIELSRSFNSFFNPNGPWGRGWTINLPHLVENRIPIEREDGKYSYTIGHVLMSPLNSLQAQFLNGHPVLSYGNPKSPIVDQKSPFRVMTENQPTFLKDAHTLLIVLKNGQEWHFSKHGDLVAVKDGPQVTVYERELEGKVTRIVGLLGGQLVGEIKLKYAKDHRLTMAVGTSFDHHQSKPIEVTYAYDDAGRLSKVTSDKGTIGYRYEGFRVAAVTWQDKAGGNQPEVLSAFQYNDQGQRLTEEIGNETIVHTISHRSNGVIASSRVDQSDKKGNSAETMVTHYDQRMRPIKAVAADGAVTVWTYPATGGVEMTVTTPDQQSMKAIETPDRSKRTFDWNGAPWLTALLNEGGQIVNLSEFGQTVLTQEWRQDGQLSRAVTSAQGSTLQYDSQGLLSSIMLHPAKAGEQFAEWQQTKLDRKGRPIEVTDYTGMHILLGYDESGAVTAAVQKAPDGKGNYGYNIKRNAQGLIEAVNSSWGNTKYTYDKDGNLQKVVATREDQSGSVELSGGRVRAMTGFDRGRTSFEYHKGGSVAGMPQSIIFPNQLKLEYNYDAEDRLSAVKVGTDRRVRFEYDPQGRMVRYAWEPVKR